MNEESNPSKRALAHVSALHEDALKVIRTKISRNGCVPVPLPDGMFICSHCGILIGHTAKRCRCKRVIQRQFDMKFAKYQNLTIHKFFHDYIVHEK